MTVAQIERGTERDEADFHVPGSEGTPSPEEVARGLRERREEKSRPRRRAQSPWWDFFRVPHA